MKRSAIVLATLAVGLALALQSSVASHSVESAAVPPTAEPQTEYQDWIRPYLTASLTGWFEGKEVPVRLALTAVDGDGGTSAQRRSPAAREREVAYGCELSVDGRIHWFYRSERGHKGSGYPTVPDSDLERLNQLLEELPDDGARLPPADRRLVVQVAQADGYLVRVYDRANAPEEVLEILRLSGSHIRSWVPEFQPVSQWRAYDQPNGGGLCLWSDGRQILSASTNGPFKFWDPETHELVKEIAKPKDVAVAGLSLSPDGSIAVVQGWGAVLLLDTQTWQSFCKLEEPIIDGKQHQLSHPHFTPEGRFLLLTFAEEKECLGCAKAAYLQPFPAPTDSFLNRKINSAK